LKGLARIRILNAPFCCIKEDRNVKSPFQARPSRPSAAEAPSCGTEAQLQVKPYRSAASTTSYNVNMHQGDFSLLALLLREDAEDKGDLPSFLQRLQERFLDAPSADHLVGTQLGYLRRGETSVGQDGLGMLSRL